VVVIPADVADELLGQTVAPEAELVRLDGVHAELDGIAGAAPLWPRVTEQPVREEAEMEGFFSQCRLHALGSETGMRQADFAAAGGHVGENGPGGRGARHRDGTVARAQLQTHAGEGRVVFVTYITDEHWPSRCVYGGRELLLFCGRRPRFTRTKLPQTK